MNTDQILLLGSIIVPAIASILLFRGIGRSDSFAKNLSLHWLWFSFSMQEFYFSVHFDGSMEGYCFRNVFIQEWGLHELRYYFSPWTQWCVISPVRDGRHSWTCCWNNCNYAQELTD